MVNSFSMSLVVRRPRSMTPGPDLRTKLTARPSNGSTVTLRKRAMTSPDQLDALVQRKERRLVGVDADADDEAVEDPAAAADDVEVAVVDRVERAGVDGEAVAQRGAHGVPPVLLRVVGRL